MTPHFTLAEATVTSTGLPNVPPPEVMERLINTAHNMEIVRAILGRRPIKINSWYRSPEVNKAVGGAKNSEHMTGAAVDFVCPSYGTPLHICRSLLSLSHILNYNQLIYEGTWVHISFPPDGVKGKLECFSIINGVRKEGIVP